MINPNHIDILAYSSGTTPIVDPAGEMFQAEGLRFSTGYPGGLYLDASFYIPRRIAEYWELNGGDRVVFYNGASLVYEGFIANFDYGVDADRQGVLVNLVGGWSDILMQRRWNKIWADIRTDDTVWKRDLTNTTDDVDMWQIERTNQIHMNPTGGTFGAGPPADGLWLVYNLPVGTYAARITYDYDFEEQSGESWLMKVQEYAGSWADLATSSVAAAGTGSKDINFSASVTAVRLVMEAAGNNNVVSDDHSHAAWTKLCLYGETGTIDLPAVCGDVIAKFGRLNSYTGYCNAMASSRSLVGTVSAPASFGAFDWETAADILIKAAAFGDADNASWAVGVKGSDTAPTPDGKPVLFCEQYPALTDYDFIVDLTDDNLNAGVHLTRSFDSLANYIIVKYTDDMGAARYITPEDDATLKNTPSINLYSQRDALLDVGAASSALALGYGKRYLARYKDPVWTMSGPIQVTGTIETRSGIHTPVSRVTAGKRLRISNWIDDITDTTGAGATFLISATDYDDDTETVSISSGPPPDFIYPVYIPPSIPQPPGEGGETDSDAIQTGKKKGGGGGATIKLNPKKSEKRKPKK